MPLEWTAFFISSHGNMSMDLESKEACEKLLNSAREFSLLDDYEHIGCWTHAISKRTGIILVHE